MTYRVMSIVVIASLALSTSRAEARDGFVEIVAGPTLVQGDDDYERLVDDTFKLGLRGGSMGDKAGFEVGIDWNDLDPPDVDLIGLETEAHRFRFMVGGRGGTRVGRVLIFGRAAIGVDYVSASISLGGNEEDRSDLGFGLEVGGGAVVDLGSFYIGGQLAIPFAFHSEDDDEDDLDNDLNLDYTSTEIDLLLNAGLRF
jgi:hypothetical protein